MTDAYDEPTELLEGTAAGRREPRAVYTRFECREHRVGLFEVMYRVQPGSLYYCQSGYPSLTPKVMRKLERENVLAQLYGFLYSTTRAPRFEVYARARREGTPRRLRSWWLPTATNQLRAAWAICDILNKHGVPLRPLMSRRLPGVEVYRSDVEVVVIPPRGLWKPRKPSRPDAYRGQRATIRYGHHAWKLRSGAMMSEEWSED
ncbi:MAG: hypothetical protein AAGG07_01895 [Planctomycetota bacterium]